MDSEYRQSFVLDMESASHEEMIVGMSMVRDEDMVLDGTAISTYFEIERRRVINLSLDDGGWGRQGARKPSHRLEQY